MLCNRCTGIYKFGNDTYPRRIRHRSNLGHIFGGGKVRLMGREIQSNIYIYICSFGECPAGDRTKFISEHPAKIRPNLLGGQTVKTD